MIQSDLDILARTVWGEARGESYAGKKAVAHVIFNRVRSTTGQFAKDDTVATACLRHVQFSVWTIGDPNLPKMEAVGLEDQDFRECLRACLEAVDEPDPTNGARHYHTESISPVWAEGHKPVLKLGAHLFYSGIR